MADDELQRTQTKDYTEEVAAALPGILKPAQSDPNQLPFVLEELLALEKKTRLAADGTSAKTVAVSVINLLFENKEWISLCDHITLLCKRRAQMKPVIQGVISRSFELVGSAPDKETKLLLINTLREVADGKIYVELERARLTHTLAKMKEEEGDVSGASDILQEVQIETVGSMEKGEKAEFLLEQLRLTIACQDFVRAELVGKKVNKKVLKSDDFQDLKLKYNNLQILFHFRYGNYLQVSQCYQEIYSTPKVSEDPKLWKHALARAVVFAVLAPHDPEQHDTLLKFKANKQVSEIPSIENVLQLFTTHEIMPRPLPQEAAWSSKDMFTGEYGQRHKDVLHDRINEHNIRTVARFYNQIRAQRLAELCQLDMEASENYLSKLVSTNSLFAKIDRPAGIISFRKAEDANSKLNEWSSDIADLLNLVEKTSQLINKENMMHNL